MYTVYMYVHPYLAYKHLYLTIIQLFQGQKTGQPPRSTIDVETSHTAAVVVVLTLVVL